MNNFCFNVSKFEGKFCRITDRFDNVFEGNVIGVSSNGMSVLFTDSVGGLKCVNHVSKIEVVKF